MKKEKKNVMFQALFNFYLDEILLYLLTIQTGLISFYLNCYPTTHFKKKKKRRIYPG